MNVLLTTDAIKMQTVITPKQDIHAHVNEDMWVMARNAKVRCLIGTI